MKNNLNVEQKGEKFGMASLLSVLELLVCCALYR